MARKLVQDKGVQRHVRLGEDYQGRAVHRGRDVFLLCVVSTSGEVQNASAEADGVLQLLKLRLALLRKSKGDRDAATMECMSELGRRMQGRAVHQEAETLMRECLAGRPRLSKTHFKDLPKACLWRASSLKATE